MLNVHEIFASFTIIENIHSRDTRLKSKVVWYYRDADYQRDSFPVLALKMYNKLPDDLKLLDVTFLTCSEGLAQTFALLLCQGVF